MANTDVIRRWFEEVWNQGREASIDELMTADAIAHGLAAPAEAHVGPAAFKPFWQQLRAAFPDIRFTIDDAIEQGDRAAARWTARMTHQGDHLGVPATQKSLTITGMVFVRIADGKIAEGWNNWDQLAMTRELGLPV
jgi:steroid delta-isomerase-like uncharacterized protein